MRRNWTRCWNSLNTFPPASAPVWAAGYPFGLGSSNASAALNSGILAGTRVVRVVTPTACNSMHRSIPATQAAPVDTSGRLIGINGQIRSRTGIRISSRLGLAISVADLRRMLPLLRTASGGYSGARHCRIRSAWSRQMATSWLSPRK